MMSKIISFSLWGDASRYCIGAVKNAELAQEIFPDWQCKFFVDESVPEDYIKTLSEFSNSEVIMTTDSEVFGAFWRFYPMFESDDNIVISRDVDSRLSHREFRCVTEWMESDKKYSIIRDHDRHYDWPILAGMWGMKGKFDPKFLPMMNHYAGHHFYTIDQLFLRDQIWKYAKEDCLIHGFNEVEWMKEDRDLNHFIGQGYDENDNPLYSGESSGEKLQ